MWQKEYTRQRDRIGLYKQKIQRYQKELMRQREENEQTIENFTTLCENLKYKGMDEVEDLQSQIQMLNDQLMNNAKEKAVLHVEIQRKDSIIDELQEVNRELVTKLQNQVINTSEFNSPSCLGEHQNQTGLISSTPMSHQGLGEQDQV